MPKTNAIVRLSFQWAIAENTAARAATIALIICQGFGGFGRAGGSRSRLVPCKRYLWLTILQAIIRALQMRRCPEEYILARMQVDYALIEFNYERPTIGNIVEMWDDEAGVRTLALDSVGVTHYMFCGEILRAVIPPNWSKSTTAPFRACQRSRGTSQ